MCIDEREGNDWYSYLRSLASITYLNEVVEWTSMEATKIFLELSLSLFGRMGFFKAMMTIITWG